MKQMGDAEGDYRRHWLLFDLLETYHAFAQLRYPGVKEALKNMERENVSLFTLFRNALQPQASLDDIKKLGDVVIGVGQNSFKASL